MGHRFFDALCDLPHLESLDVGQAALAPVPSLTPDRTFRALTTLKLPHQLTIDRPNPLTENLLQRLAQPCDLVQIGDASDVGEGGEAAWTERLGINRWSWRPHKKVRHPLFFRHALTFVSTGCKKVL